MWPIGRARKTPAAILKSVDEDILLVVFAIYCFFKANRFDVCCISGRNKKQIPSGTFSHFVIWQKRLSLERGFLGPRLRLITVEPPSMAIVKPNFHYVIKLSSYPRLIKFK